MPFVLASNNAGKLSEFSELFQNMGLTVAPQRDYGVTDADETGLSFIENALIKARHASEATGLPAIADDSGLVVPALGGAPCLLYTSPSPRDGLLSRMPSSA